MAATTRRAGQHVTLLIVVLASITVLTLNYRGEASRGIGRVRSAVADGLAPVQRGVAAALHPIGDVFAGAVHYGSAIQQISNLRQEVASLERKSAVASYEAAQSEQVLALDHLRDASGVPSVVAPVILTEGNANFEETIELGIGTSSGVGFGMPVEAAGGPGGSGLVGTVIAAGSSTATVRLIDDRRFAVDGRFGNGGSGSVTVLSGQGPGRPLTASDPGLVAHRNEPVFTSGLATATYPAGIPIGVVDSVTDPGGLSATVSVTPYADTSGLGYVAVLLWTPTA